MTRLKYLAIILLYYQKGVAIVKVIDHNAHVQIKLNHGSVYWRIISWRKQVENYLPTNVFGLLSFIQNRYWASGVCFLHKYYLLHEIKAHNLWCATISNRKRLNYCKRWKKSILPAHKRQSDCLWSEYYKLSGNLKSYRSDTLESTSYLIAINKFVFPAYRKRKEKCFYFTMI